MGVNVTQNQCHLHTLIPSRCVSPQIICNPNSPPLTPTRMGYFFQNTQNLKKGFKTFNCPTLLVGDTFSTPLVPSVAKTHFCPLKTLPGCKNQASSSWTIFAASTIMRAYGFYQTSNDKSYLFILLT